MKQNQQKRVVETERRLLRVFDDFTVIIPTVGRPTLRRCLHSVVSGKVLPRHIIVIDQGENPAVLEWLRSIKVLGLEIFHLPSMERSPGSARNRGLQQVQTPFVVALDDDCVAEVDWLEKMGLHLRKYPAAIVTGQLPPGGDGVPPTMVTSTVPCFYTRPSVRILSPLNSANMGFALRTFQRVGLFDEELFAAEDNEWAYRALRVGVSIIYVPEIIAYHHHWRDKVQMTATYRDYAWSQGVFYGKHLRRGDWSMALRIGFSLYRGMRSLFYGVIKNNYNRRVSGYANVIWLLPGVVIGLWRLETHRER